MSFDQSKPKDIQLNNYKKLRKTEKSAFEKATPGNVLQTTQKINRLSELLQICFIFLIISNHLID